MKKGKQINLVDRESFKCSFGTVNHENPKAIFIKISSWGEPNYNDDIDYGSIIRKLTKSVKQATYLNASDKLFYPDKSIVDLKMKESGITYGKKSYMGCEITLFQKNNYTLNELVNEIQNLTDSIISNSFEINDYFTFHKKK